MVKIDLKGTYLGVKTSTSLKNEVFTCWIMYYGKYPQVMVKQSINEFHTWFLFKMDALPQEIVSSLDIYKNFFNNLRTEVRELFI